LIILFISKQYFFLMFLYYFLNKIYWDCVWLARPKKFIYFYFEWIFFKKLYWDWVWLYSQIHGCVGLYLSAWHNSVGLYLKQDPTLNWAPLRCWVLLQPGLVAWAMLSSKTQ
jgi:hypothetical protein